MAGSPVAGSVKVAAPAIGTSLAGPSFVPGGCAAAVVARVAVGEGVDAFDADGEPAACDDAEAVAAELAGALGSEPNRGYWRRGGRRAMQQPADAGDRTRP